MTTAIVYHPDYLKHETGAHPERPERAALIAQEIKERDLENRYVWLTPQACSQEDILRCHASNHYDLVHQACEKGLGALDADTIISKDSFQVSLMASGGVITAIDAVMDNQVDNAFVIVRPPGHHATPDRPMGFCLFNNVAVGARYAQTKCNLEQVLIVDWDVHHGNGTQDMFYLDNSVFYFSLHQYPHYPGTGRTNDAGEGNGQGYTFNAPLGAGTSAKDYRNVFDEALKKILSKTKPDLILISAGFDSHREDPLGQLMLENEDFAWMTTRLKQVAQSLGHQRVISVLEGGYNLKKLGKIAVTHVEALAENL
ncbi:MAG: histone deacetylase superfamily protein [bacterium]|nr:MAG: histone deacetylase superfamily protein [bacterium]